MLLYINVAVDHTNNLGNLKAGGFHFISFNFVYPRYPFRYLKKYLISQGAVLKSKYTKFKDVRLIINGYWLTIINGYWLTD